MVGRASTYIIPPTAQVIVIRKLREALLPNSLDQKEKENTEAASRTGFVAQEYGFILYWVPSSVTGVQNSQFAHYHLKREQKHQINGLIFLAECALVLIFFKGSSNK